MWMISFQDIFYLVFRTNCTKHNSIRCPVMANDMLSTDRVSCCSLIKIMSGDIYTIVVYTCLRRLFITIVAYTLLGPFCFLWSDKVADSVIIGIKQFSVICTNRKMMKIYNYEVNLEANSSTYDTDALIRCLFECIGR